MYALFHPYPLTEQFCLSGMKGRKHMAAGKKKKILSLLILLPLVVIGFLSFFLLSGKDVAVSTYKQTLQNMISDTPGWSFDAGPISGNPVTGYVAEDVRIFYLEREIARAKSLAVRLSLLSLARGNPEASRVTLREVFLPAEEFFAALRETDFPPSEDEEGSLEHFPVVVLTSALLSAPGGDILLENFRLSPGEGSITFAGGGKLLNLPLEVGGSLVAEDGLSVSNAYLKAGEAVLTLSGSLSPEVTLEGTLEKLSLQQIAPLAALPSGVTGTLASTVLLSRPGGSLLLSGEGTLTKGNISGLETDGKFLWSADGGKLTLDPGEATVFSSPVRGNLSFFFGEDPQAEMNLFLKNVRFDEWTDFFPWLSSAEGTLSTLDVSLAGPLDRLSGPVQFSASKILAGGIPVTDVKGSVVLEESDRFALQAAGRWQGSLLTVDGGSEPKGRGLRFLLRSESLDLKKAGAVYGPSLALEGTGTADGKILLSEGGDLQIIGFLKAPKFALLGTRGESLSVAFTGNEKQLDFSSLSVKIPGGGDLSGSGKVTSLDTNEPGVNFTGTGKNIPASFLESLLSKDSPLGGKGTFDLQWGLSGPLGKPAATFQLRGKDTPLSPLLPLRKVVLNGRYAGDRLLLSDGSASLLGGQVSLGGEMALSGAPSLDLRGKISGLSAAALASLGGAELPKGKGEISGEYVLAGKADSPKISLSLSSPSLSLEDTSLDDLRLRAEGTLPDLKIQEFSARFGKSLLSAAGSVSLAKGGAINLKASGKDLDLRSLSAAFFPGSPLGGSMDGEVSLTGTLGGKQTLLFSGKAPLVTLHGTLLEDVNVTVRPKGQDRFAFSMEGLLGSSSLALTGEIEPTEDGAAFSVKNSSKIDIAATAAGYSSQAAGIVRGEADFEAKGRIGKEGLTAEGTISSGKVGFYRTEAKDVKIPFLWKDNLMTVKGGKAIYYGGTADLSGTLDPATMRWEGNLSVKGFSLERVTTPMLDGEGAVTGTADLTMRGSGTGGMVGLVFGSGQLAAREGAVKGFEAVKSVSPSGEIPFTSVLASFNVDGRNIFLLPGSRISAPPGNDVYRYFSASGSLGWNEAPLDLKCLGDINIRALNAFLGALQGIISIDGNPLTDPQFLSNFLTGLLGGMSVRDFRETTFNLKGSWESPALADLKVKSNQMPANIPRSGPGNNGETKIKISVEIPTGEGKDTGTSTEDQVKKQLLENIMKQIIRPGTTEDSLP